MTFHRMLWKDGLDLTDDSTKIFAVNVLDHLSINLENVINFTA